MKAKVVIEFEDGTTQKIEFKTFNLNLERDIQFNGDPDDGDKNNYKVGKNNYKVGTKFGVLHGILED